MNQIVLAAMTIALALAYPNVGEEQPQLGAKEMFFDPQRSVGEASTARRPAKITGDDGRRISRLSSNAAVLGLSHWIELITDAGRRGLHVTEERTFRSGDRIRLHFRGNVDGRIVIVQLGSSGASSVLFPDAAKGLAENRIHANRDHVLPSHEHWFRFDERAGTERLLVLFAKNQDELDRAFPTRSVMDSAATEALLYAVRRTSGSKDLLIERETHEPSEIGYYVVNVAGRPIALEIALKHR